MEYVQTDSSEVPRELLLEADPSEARIAAYLEGAWCYAAKHEGRIVGACIARPLRSETAEIYNVSVYPALQRQGIGTAMLRFALADLAGRGMRRVELGTGTFGDQLIYYQRIGFRVDGLLKNHFLQHYPEPLIEDGVQHRDMLRLSIELSEPGTVDSIPESEGRH